VLTKQSDQVNKMCCKKQLDQFKMSMATK